VCGVSHIATERGPSSKRGSSGEGGWHVSLNVSDVGGKERGDKIHRTEEVGSKRIKEKHRGPKRRCRGKNRRSNVPAVPSTGEVEGEESARA